MKSVSSWLFFFLYIRTVSLRYLSFSIDNHRCLASVRDKSRESPIFRKRKINKHLRTSVYLPRKYTPEILRPAHKLCIRLSEAFKPKVKEWCLKNRKKKCVRRMEVFYPIDVASVKVCSSVERPLEATTHWVTLKRKCVKRPLTSECSCVRHQKKQRLRLK